MSRFAILICLLLPCLAESRISLRGLVKAHRNTDYSLLRVVVVDANERTELGAGRLHGDGSFRFDDLPRTIVEVQLVSPHGDPILHRFVALPSTDPVQLELPSNAAGGNATVSMYRLKYQPSDAAARHWEEAVRALKRHDWAAAAPELEQALAASPDFADAHEHRGLIALAAGQYHLAARHLLRAAELDPADPQFLSNAALACLSLARDREAEDFARAMLRVEPGSERGYFLLGTALARQNRNRAEAISALNRAQTVFPEARAALQKLR